MKLKYAYGSQILTPVLEGEIPPAGQLFGTADGREWRVCSSVVLCDSGTPQGWTTIFVEQSSGQKQRDSAARDEQRHREHVDEIRRELCLEQPEISNRKETHMETKQAFYLAGRRVSAITLEQQLPEIGSLVVLEGVRHLVESIGQEMARSDGADARLDHWSVHITEAAKPAPKKLSDQAAAIARELKMP